MKPLEQQWKWKIKGDLEEVRPLLEAMTASLTSQGVPSQDMMNLKLLFAEAINNAVEHGCVGFDDPEVEVSLNLSGSHIRVTVDDPSQFVPEPVPASEPEDMFAEGGRGLFLMEQIADKVDHDSLPDGRHRLILETSLEKKPRALPAASDYEEMLESLSNDLSASYETVAVLLGFGELLAASTNFDEIAPQALHKLFARVDCSNAVLRFPNKRGSLTESIEWRGEKNYKKQHLSMLAYDATEQVAFQEGKREMVEDVSTLRRDDPLFAECGCAVVFPIHFKSKVVGILSLRRDSRREFFSAGDLGLIQAVCDFIGIARTTGELHEQREAQLVAMREVEIASDIQRLLLPTEFPTSTGIDLHGICLPARQVGGDYYDVIQIPGKGWLLVVADVMGKGVPAAMLATLFRSHVRARISMGDQPGRMMTEIASDIHSDLDRLDMFVTAQIVFVDLSGRHVETANAGHCPLLRIRNGELVDNVESNSGPPLGVLEGIDYESDDVEAQPKDLFLMYTDGLYEANRPSGEMLGVEEFYRMVLTHEEDPVNFVTRGVIKRVEEWSKNAPPSDDRTLIVFRSLAGNE